MVERVGKGRYASQTTILRKNYRHISEQLSLFTNVIIFCNGIATSKGKNCICITHVFLTFQDSYMVVFLTFVTYITD